ncbi:nicotinate phosphoribosyltransferase [Peptostreptococcus equinus]|uniref:Nicotinate phosphoribosyltransferase n=1 Tax=Peptostreptococcus equinus TaxID=3003601 RepID=A0ABY7JTH6_9FIRM|nr:nicotinate phosphoribosyltransferase [Peptostreptococcus sp. CBA3647]WAW15022.1 nicotinate phosphoribosyltransferase [Peptostreptococcus sp. CBA3647]
MKTNLTMLTDLYQLTMMNGYFKKGIHEDIAVFDVFFRKNVCEGGYTIVCGMEEVVHYVQNLAFNDHDIEYLKGLGLFDDEFLEFLRKFKFTGDIYAVEDGTVMYPGEPILIVKAPLYQAQLVETAILSIVNFMTLIATKASRVCYAANGDPVLEFGLRRAQGPEAGLYGAKAAIIGGCVGTSNVLTGKMFNVPISGTHAHSWVQKFDTELDAFRAYADTYPETCLLLIDTYNVLDSGIKNAITVFKELREKGYEPLGVRLDSGDLTYLSKEVRKRLDEAGFPDAKITASNDLDEYTITSLKQEGAVIDSWGVGTKLITSYDYPSLGGVYKLCATTNKEGILEPKIKISENPEKINNPGFKKVVRIYNSFGKSEADLIMLSDEEIDTSKPLEIFDPIYTWKTKTYENYKVKEMLSPLFLKGICVREKKTVEEVKDHTRNELACIWNQYKRIKNPHIYKVDLSQKLWDLKQNMIAQKKKF